ncbi:SDR family NAD(P)-dependent oxidoreductase [Metabacillus rhizolycopersici]|uniref:SDR family NAD(P)-dependent oxidoreductase n=1 Tax=Metabacillus rhizolycopersici TaxID=2875709 RepID=A0ABS7UY31_9BACI|nr:SDR family NAD(P)-dependent oxidoreductase [Metabacillus rhizolycopersici]MBZ5752939.1 SDR family NAD(P)-dependent oxidoreductase [Metabacillus rhizolycopersici]
MDNVSFSFRRKSSIGDCGASRGIGRALAEGLAMAGADVILVAQSKNEIEQGA